MTPDKQALIGLIMGVVLTFGLRAAIAWLSARADRMKPDIERMRKAVAKARLTPDRRDDAIADLAYEKARNDHDHLLWWKDNLALLLPWAGQAKLDMPTPPSTPKRS